MSWEQLREIATERAGETIVIPKDECPRDGEVLMVNSESDARCPNCGWPLE